MNDTIQITAPMDEREFFTLPQLAAWLGLKPRSIYWMNHRGEGPPRHRIAGKVLYRKSDVERWLQGRRIG